VNAISALLARATAPSIALERRVRPVDRSCAGGFVVSDDADGVFWIGDDGWDHLSKADYVENEANG
jgi:hypothetical protein